MKRGDWSGIYMIIVVIIAAVLVLTLVKPLFVQAADSSRSNLGYSSDLVRAALSTLW
ncbi:MAG: hypothetical protein WC408_03670 [Candidatus Micrarchaeia archaeon]|jgi:hypothetical protein